MACSARCQELGEVATEFGLEPATVRVVRDETSHYDLSTWQRVELAKLSKVPQVGPVLELLEMRDAVLAAHNRMKAILANPAMYSASIDEERLWEIEESLILLKEISSELRGLYNAHND